MSTTNRPRVHQVALLTSALAVGSGLGGLAQASITFMEPPVVASPALSSIAQLRRISNDTIESAHALADGLWDIYQALNDGTLEEEIDPAEYVEMVNVMRSHEAIMDRIMQSGPEARDVLMPLRRAVAKARSNASIVANLGRQKTGEQARFTGKANLAGLAKVAKLNTEHLAKRIG